jgi:hypothetical protein
MNYNNINASAFPPDSLQLIADSHLTKTFSNQQVQIYTNRLNNYILTYTTS